MGNKNYNRPFPQNPTPVVAEEEKVEAVVTPEVPVAETPVLMGVISNCEKLNVRTEMSKESEVLTIIKVGEEFEVEETEDSSWLKIYLASGVTGFVCAEFVMVK